MWLCMIHSEEFYNRIGVFFLFFSEHIDAPPRATIPLICTLISITARRHRAVPNAQHTPWRLQEALSLVGRILFVQRVHLGHDLAQTLLFPVLLVVLLRRLLLRDRGVDATDDVGIVDAAAAATPVLSTTVAATRAAVLVVRGVCPVIDAVAVRAVRRVVRGVLVEERAAAGAGAVGADARWAVSAAGVPIGAAVV